MNSNNSPIILVEQIRKQTCYELSLSTTHIYTDGGVYKANPSTKCGTWAFCLVSKNDKRLASFSGFVKALPNKPISNNTMEQIAICIALESMPDKWSGTVCSDSIVALGRVFSGWATNGLPANVSLRSKIALSRLGDIATELIEGHPSKKDLKTGFGSRSGYRVSQHNVHCDNLCNLEKRRYEEHTDFYQF